LSLPIQFSAGIVLLLSDKIISCARQQKQTTVYPRKNRCESENILEKHLTSKYRSLILHLSGGVAPQSRKTYTANVVKNHEGVSLGTMLAFLRNVYARPAVLGAKFRFGRPKFFSYRKKSKIRLCGGKTRKAGGRVCTSRLLFLRCGIHSKSVWASA